MKKMLTSNKGVTLIELITSIAIFSIVGISCFTLLMFSIRTNNFILTGTSACKDAELLNNRLEYLFEDNTVEFDGKNSAIIGENILTWDDTNLMQGETVIQDNILVTSFEVMTNTLLRITYTIDDTYTCTKVFRCGSCSTAEESSQSES